MKFLAKILNRHPHRVAAHRLYVMAADQARSPALFALDQVPDTLDGRFDALALHVFLLLHRLRRQGEAGLELSHEIVDVLISDMDRTLRETGIADVGVGKRVKNMLRAFYGRIGAYDAGLEEADDAALRAALARNIYRGAPPEDVVLEGFAAYVRRQAAVLAAQPLERFMQGVAVFEAMPAVDDGRQHA